VIAAGATGASAAGTPEVLCIVPAHDEADRIAATVRHLYRIRGVDRVVVIDDGSTDGTADAALSAGATVLSCSRNLGKGSALEASLDRLPIPQAYLLVDADVGETAVAAARLLEAVRTGAADLAIGRLPPPAVGGFGLVKRMAAWLIRRASGFEATEPLSGQRAAGAGVLQACRPLARGFGVETAMTIDAVRRGYRVVELDVAMRHRPTGRDVRGFLHRGRQGVEILMAGVARLTFRRR
jgi:glycosyltransferase involved in cell wall biosynthesis